MSDTTPKWMLEAANALSTLNELDSDDGLEGWDFDPDGWFATWPEDDAPGWEVSLEGGLLTVEWGGVKFASDTDGDVLRTARRLLAGLDGYNGTSSRPDRADVHRLLRLALLQWHGAQTALLELYGLRPAEDDPRLPGYVMVLDFLMRHAPCGNGPLDRAIATELGERSPFWYAHGGTKPVEPDETAALVAQLRARVAELEAATEETP